MIEQLHTMERDIEVLERLSLPTAPDGFGGGGSSSGSGQGGAWTNPVEQHAARRAGYRQPNAEVLAEHAIRKLHTAATIVDQMNGCRTSAIPPDPDAGPDDQWCTHCIKTKVVDYEPRRILEPRAAGRDAPQGTTLCRWCYRWEKANGFLPPSKLVRQHHVEGRVRARDAAEAIAAHEATKAAEKAKAAVPATDDAATVATVGDAADLGIVARV
jgi:hypothetical protein